MKKVVTQKTPVDEIDVRQVNTSKYYLLHKNGEYGFITQQNYSSGKYITRCYSKLTIGNSWDAFLNDNLVQLITDLMASGFKVYEFDTCLEMFEAPAQYNFNLV